MAVTGRPREALLLQARVARAFMEIYADEDVGYPLAEWARLAGAMRDAEALAHAAALHERALGAGAYRGFGGRYVDLALARGALLLDAADTAARHRAALLAMDDALPDTLRWSALRVIGAEARAVLKRDAVAGHRVAARQLVLVELDDALQRGQHDAAEACVTSLAMYDPGPVGHLERAGASAVDVARLYPY